MPTLTRGLVTLVPVDILGWSTTRVTASVVHPIMGDPEPDITLRVPGLSSGELRTLWGDEAGALAARDALAAVGGPWVLTVPERPTLAMTFQVVGDITLAALADTGTGWSLTCRVQEVAA